MGFIIETHNCIIDNTANLVYMSSKHYLDRNEFHKELSICKKQDKLTDKAVKMFQIMCKEVSRKYFFTDPEDQNDAISQAIFDCIKYWRGFKESNVVQLQFARNFKVGESIKIVINNYEEEIEYKASNEPDMIFREFKIDESPKKKDTYLINKTLSNLSKTIKTRDGKVLAIFIDKVKNKITLMDIYNGDSQSLTSYLELNLITDDLIVPDKNKKKKNIEYTNKYFFTPPPNCFSYFTSLVSNGLLKSINKTNPKQLRNGNKVSLNINSEANGLYNF